MSSHPSPTHYIDVTQYNNSYSCNFYFSTFSTFLKTNQSGRDFGKSFEGVCQSWFLDIIISKVECSILNLTQVIFGNVTVMATQHCAYT